MHGVLTPSQSGFVGCEPTKWSPSSTVKTKSVLLLLIPCVSEPIKELAERLVIVFQLLNIVRFTRATGRMDFTRNTVLVVRIRDVAERDGIPASCICAI